MMKQITFPVIDHRVNKNIYQHTPTYLNQLSNYPKDNPILLTLDWQGFNYIRRLKGLCVLCDKTKARYDFSYFYQREVWVLYTSEDDFNHALKMAHEIQSSGAIRVLLILMQITKPEVVI